MAHVGGGPTFYALPFPPLLSPLISFSFLSFPSLRSPPSLFLRARTPFSREVREIVQADCILAWRTRTDSGKRLYRKHGGGDPSVPRVNIPRLSFMYRRWRYIVVKAGDAPGVISIIRFTTFFPPPPPPVEEEVRRGRGKTGRIKRVAAFAISHAWYRKRGNF